MNNIDKKYVILGSLCALVLTLAVGYAAFNAVLNIKGTTNINSNWDVKITGIEKIESKGATDNEGSPSYDNISGLSATFNTNFTTPGDYATYKIEITNNGSLDALLSNIKVPENTNNDIIFYLNKNQNNEDIPGALTQNSTLFKTGETGNIGYVYVTVLYKDYEDQQTAQEKTSNMTITFDFEQATGNGGTIGGQTAADKLIETAVTTGDGLYKDEYENGRYVYKGANPNNYITFNNETWRILAVETDGTIKIMKKDSIGDRAWDTENATTGRNNANNTYCQISSGTYIGCNAWSKMEGTWTNANKTGTVTQDASLNTYLNNDYYNTLSSEAQVLIQTHSWGIGTVTWNNTDLAAQIESENGTTWNGEIGLMSLSDYIRANTNTEQCGNYKLNNSNYSICKTTNYIVPSSGYLWTISPSASNSNSVFFVLSDGDVGHTDANTSAIGVVPALYLTSNITLEGEGTESNPYTIVS